jgi:outer membrane protein assembly factor BamD (BamD/ComL family)
VVPAAGEDIPTHMTAPGSNDATAEFRAAFDRPASRDVWRAGRALAAAAVLLTCSGFLTGCTSLLDKKLDVKNILGPVGRKAQAEVARRDPKAPLEGSEEFDAAKAQFEIKDYAQARKAFKKIAKKYKDKPIEEDAMFMLAECDYHQKHYPDAQDSYDELLKKYPSTRHLEDATKRQFAIARYWLNAPKPASAVELTHFTQEDPQSRLEDLPEARVPYSFPLTPNLFDRSRPLFDAQGRALQALRSVWINDPTGPLADDALMMAATHHLRKGDYQEADHIFGNVREQYADREHASAAYVLGQHASFKSYQGARYDAKQLDEARKLTDSALRLYPDLPQKKKLEVDLRRMKQEAAERDWQRVQYHLKRREKDSAAVYAEYIVEQFPGSPQAAEARKLLIELGPDFSQGILRTPLHKPPATPVDPHAESGFEVESVEPDEPGRVSLSDEDRPIAEEE